MKMHLRHEVIVMARSYLAACVLMVVLIKKKENFTWRYLVLRAATHVESARRHWVADKGLLKIFRFKGLKL